eukprot:snap_masked-scaffold_15-processed-gene-4.36-mRNA-1 protein AED:0.13 eAED:0.18 QI:0/-1/0/1/-1/1/1/0/174
MMRTRKVKIYKWVIPAGSMSVKRYVFQFLNDYKGATFDVIMLDPPYQFCQGNPIRGPANDFNQVQDSKLLELNFDKVARNKLIFIWTFWGKRDIIFRCLEKWGLKYIDHVLWVKITCNGKVRSTLGNMTLKCVEELLICGKGELPVNLEKRNFGKEISMAPSTGNCRKPKKYMS